MGPRRVQGQAFDKGKSRLAFVGVVQIEFLGVFSFGSHPASHHEGFRRLRHDADSPKTLMWERHLVRPLLNGIIDICGVRTLVSKEFKMDVRDAPVEYR